MKVSFSLWEETVNKYLNKGKERWREKSEGRVGVTSIATEILNLSRVSR